MSDRYRKQTLFSGLGETGQERLCRSTAVLIGCGALGSVIAESLVRAGVGTLRLIDRDFVELSNLQRQVLYDEQDVADRLPKAIAATNKLQRINSTVRIEPHVADVTHGNILEFIVGADLILDGTDNFEIRFLINDAAVETGTPWVHAGCVGSQGQTMTVRPGITPCFRCLMPEAPGPGTGDTCDTAGVIGPAVQIMASLQVIDALKILSGQPELIPPRLTIVDVWTGSFRHLNLETLSRKNCSCCGGSERLWLSGEKGSQSTVLCGRNSVQIAPVSSTALSFDTIARRLQSQGTVRVNPFLLTFRPMEMETTIPQADSHQSHSQLELTLFRDGRAIISGTEDLIAAKAFYVRFIGT